MRSRGYFVAERSTAPRERIFELLTDATSWPRWAGFFIGRGSWEREGDPRPGGVGAIRKLGRPPLYGREEIVVYEPPFRHDYRILSGQPVVDYRAKVELVRDGPGTLIMWSATFVPVIPGTGWLLTTFYRRLIRGFARRVAAYAEQESNSS